MSQVNSPVETSREDAFDLADILLTLAENIRLLFMGPIVLGIMAFGLAHLLPEKFESVAILKADSSIAAYMTSASVLDGALKNLGYLKNLNEDEAEEARIHLAGQVSAQAGRNDQLVTLRVTATSPEAAQRMANEILKLTVEAAKPGEVEFQRLTLEKDTLSRQAVELAAASKTAQRILERGESSDNLGPLAESIAVISNNLITVRERIYKVEQKLMGISNDDLLQSPTLPRKSYAPNKPLFAVLTTVVSGLIFLILVFLRQALRTSHFGEKHDARWSAIKRKYHIGR